MKLVHYTYRKLSVYLLLLMAIWGTLFYYMVVDEVLDETDDTLENYGDMLIKSALEDPSFLETQDVLMSAYSFRPISKEEGENYRTVYYDSTIYIEIEDEEEPVRVMRTAFRMPDGQYYELTLRISVLEREDMMEGVLGYLAVLFLLFLVATSVGTRMILHRAFQPLNHLLQWLHQLQPGHQVPPLENPSPIREFKQLSEAAVDMGNRSYRAYEEQKQFIENASHELQTPLAIARGKVELLAESDALTEQQMKELDAIYATLGRAVKLNKSLLLLSRIENGQYAEMEDVDFDELLDRLMPDLLDIYEHKHLKVDRHRSDVPLVLRCHHSLAQILLTNLIKNALLHAPDSGCVRVVTTADTLEISNTGAESLDTSKLFRRFYHTLDDKKESTGLGLAIAQSIASSSQMQLTYRWEDGWHVFRLSKGAETSEKLNDAKKMDIEDYSQIFPNL